MTNLGGTKPQDCNLALADWLNREVRDSGPTQHNYNPSLARIRLIGRVPSA